ITRVYEPKTFVRVGCPMETQRRPASRCSRYQRLPLPGRTWPQTVVRRPRLPDWTIGSMNELNDGLITPAAEKSPLCQPESWGSSLTMKWIRTSTNRALLARSAVSATYLACTDLDTPKRSGGFVW